MSVSPFIYKDYKKYLQAILSLKDTPRGQLSRWSEAAGCQPSFLSQVLKSNVQMTPDQASGIARFLNLSDEASEYFLTLVDFARAASPHLKKRLQRRLDQLKNENEDLGRRMDKANFTVDEDTAFFFSGWLWSALQVLVSIPNYQSAKEIAQRLGLSEKVTISSLENLQAHGFVSRQSDGRWIYSGKPVHLKKESPHVVFHHQNWRGRAALDAQSHNKDSVHFTGVFALSQADAEKLKEMMLNFIEQANAVVTPSPEEEAICINCDFFKV